MNLISSVKYSIKNISLLIVAFVTMGSIARAADLPKHHEDRLLICLPQSVQVGSMGKSSGLPVLGISSIDRLIALHEVIELEKYLPSATPDDIVGDINLYNIYRMRINPDRTSLEQAMTDFNADKNVLYSEYETIDRPHYIPDDPQFPQQWYMPKVQAPEGWDLWDIPAGVLPGTRRIVLASVDSGVEYTHPDLWKNVWINQAEVPVSIFAAVDTDSDGYVSAVEVVAHIQDNNVDGHIDLQDALHSSSPFMDGIDGDDWDSDPATYIDDLLGWDVSGATSGADQDNDPIGAVKGKADVSTLMHGTHVAGLLTATTDNATGIASAAYNGSLMSVKCLFDDDRDGYISGGYDGLLYAAKAGADIINLSWGSYGYNSLDHAVVNLVHNTYGAIIVSSAGNDDSTGTGYPSGYYQVVSVAATNSTDAKADFSNYGATIDLSAPGANIYSTVFTSEGSYQSWDGTSMASPIVASCFGLLKAAYPDQTNDWLIATMEAAADPIDDINPDYIDLLGVGRININRALATLLIPLLEFNSYELSIINDDGDGKFSVGEEAQMSIEFFNLSEEVDALDVSAELNSPSPYVTITDSLGSYALIATNDSSSNIADQFQFSVSPEAPVGSIPFSVEIKANKNAEYPYSKSFDFEIETNMWQENFPRVTSSIRSGTAVVDLSPGGGREIIFGAYDSSLHAITKFGTELSGFPVHLGNKIEATPAVGDLDQDGDLEIVVGSLDQNLYVIQHDGDSSSIYTSTSYLWASSTLYDLDNDGDLEIITPSFNRDLLIVHHDGTPYANFPITLDGQMTAGAAIADVNRDGALNIVVGTWGSTLHCLNLDGTEVTGFPVSVGGRIKSAPTLANIDSSIDGSLEILFGCDDNNFYALDAGGNELWRFTTEGQTIQADPAISDLDGDDDLEIVFGGLNRKIYILDHEGSVLPGWPVTTGGEIFSSAGIADVDGDGLAEVFIGSKDRYLYGLHLDGSDVSGFPVILSERTQGAVSIADIDRDGDVEIIVGTDNGIAVLDLTGTAFEGAYWPTHRGNLYRTGALPSILVSNKESIPLPDHAQLYANYPNPFNPTTRISFDIPEAAHVNLDILDLRGRLVDVLVSEYLPAGSYTLNWNGKRGGKPVSAGIYLYRLSTPDGNMIRKMTLLK